MIASHRQNRPQMPKDYCPFCPGSGKVPDKFDVYKYDNDPPAFRQNPPTPDDADTDFFETAPAYGKCEVILYSSNHTITLPELPTEHIVKLVDLWAEPYAELSKDENIKYVFAFENRGDVVGVTMPHPYGQIHGYSFIPKKLKLELENAKKHKEEKDTCVFCDWLKAEQDDVSDEYHFHIAFYPPMRSADKVKYKASSETGAWAHCNPTYPEDTAEELRQAYERFMGK